MIFYIYYNNDTGDILSISNDKEIEFGKFYIEINKDIYKTFVSGEKNINDFSVLTSKDDPTIIELVEKVKFVKNNSYISKIKKSTISLDNHFLISQDTSKQLWNITHNLDSRRQLYYSQLDKESSYREIYVVKHDNNNVLVDKLSFYLKEVLTSKQNSVIIKNNIPHDLSVSLVHRPINEEYLHLTECK